MPVTTRLLTMSDSTRFILSNNEDPLLRNTTLIGIYIINGAKHYLINLFDDFHCDEYNFRNKSNVIIVTDVNGHSTHYSGNRKPMSENNDEIFIQ